MTVKTQPVHVPSLIAFLTERPDAVVARVAEDRVAVSFLGSRTVRSLELELQLRLGAWSRRRNAPADILLAA